MVLHRTSFRPPCVSSGPVPWFGGLLPLTYVSTGILLPSRHTPMMDTSWPSTNLLLFLSEESYDSIFASYRHWIELEATRVGVTDRKLYDDVLGSTRSDLIMPPYLVAGSSWSRGVGGKLIHDNAQLLLRFVTDVEQDPTLSTYAVGLHEQLCRSSLDEFFRRTLYYMSGPSDRLQEFYTRVNLIAHWVNLGYVKLEDVRDRILQSLTMHPTPLPHQLNSLMILLKISGATFAAYVNPSVMDRCCDLLKPSNLCNKLVLTRLAEVRVFISTTRTGYISLDYRRFYDFVKKAGKASPFPRLSAAQSLKPFDCRTPRRLRLRFLWGSRAWQNNLRHLRCPRLFQRPPQTGTRNPQLLRLRQPALLPCLISPSPTISMKNRSSNPKLLLLTIHSTSKMEVLKYYVAKPSFASTPACCHSILRSFVKCFHRQSLLLPSLQMGAHALCPPTYQLILQLS